MILLSHPAADADVGHVAVALNRAGVLGEFWTCLDDRKSSILLRIPPDLLAPAARGPGPADGSDAPFPFVEIMQPALRRPAPRGRPRRPGSNAVCRSLDRKMSARLESDRFRGVYAYEDGAAESFRAAGRRGLLRIYDLPHGHWRAGRAILEQEAALEPEWAGTLGRPRDSPRKLARKDEELEQADLILTPSTFALRTIEESRRGVATVAVIPHGAPLAPDDAAPPAFAHRFQPRAAGAPLRVLFAGDLTQRNGLSYLFRACRELGSAVELTVAGSRPLRACAALDRALRHAAWQPATTAEQLSRAMAAHDVFALPALFDQSGHLLLQAMSMGLPIVATPHTVAPDVIDDGVEGFLVPIRSSAALAEKLLWLRDQPEARHAMSLSARRRARRHSWDNFERTLAASVATALARH